MTSPASGFWGHPTSSIDWCETNYAHTRYVCELFNTLSSTALLVVGVLGLLLHGRTLERRFLLAFVAVSIVGMGSIAFHATLRFELQMLDELPMLYAALAIIYILLEDAPRHRYGRWLPAVLAVHAIVVTSLSAFPRGALQFYLFQSSFASLEIFAFYRVYRLQRRTRNETVRALGRLGASSYAIAVLLWFLDLKACGVLGGVLPAHGIPNPQLHAWWHVLVSCGLYLLLLMLACDRFEVLGRRPALRFAAGFVPYVVPEEPGATSSGRAITSGKGEHS